MGSNYQDILRNFGTGATKPSYSKASSYGPGSSYSTSGASYGTTTGGKSYATSGGNSYGTTGGRTYVKVNSTGSYGGYGGFGGFGGGSGGTVIGGDEEVTKETVRNRWANRFE